MPKRAPSPAPSENEVDIAGALFANDADSDGDVGTRKKPNAAADLDFNDLLNAGGDGGSDEDGDDEDFIALHQRSSNRKASNLQGKTVKKGGGFQAMGAFDSALDLPIDSRTNGGPSQASTQTCYEPLPGKASLFPRPSSARRYPSSWRDATSWAWPGLAPARPLRSSSP